MACEEKNENLEKFTKKKKLNRMHKKGAPQIKHYTYTFYKRKPKYVWTCISSYSYGVFFTICRNYFVAFYLENWRNKFEIQIYAQTSVNIYQQNLQQLCRRWMPLHFSQFLTIFIYTWIKMCEPCCRYNYYKNSCIETKKHF